ncbi:SMI1/KNR4 family protein [Streptomyces sp. NPDC048527]|uniref:SMI1/KNR4 family protein n=1 Tax=Streptomyces sp. NPDC048527 TaxID=3365568 RepID=UPI00371D8C09
MEIFEWGPLLKRWSEEWLEGTAAEEPEEFEELDEEIVRRRWLGFDPAGPARLVALEERLRGLGTEVPLPPSFRSFLETSDGWRHAGGFVHLLAGVDRVAPYGDPYGLQPMYEEQLDQDSAEEEVLRAGMWGLALQLSLDSDMTDVLLDPGDVGADGEWAVYVYHGWGGEYPERYDSFRAFMEDMYKEFYRLAGGHSGFENVVTRELDAKVEEARLACLRGELDEALAVFREAGDLGRPRAVLLAAQLRALLDGRGWVPVDPRMDDPLYAGEVLPLKVRDHLREHRRDDTFVLGPATEDYASDRERAGVVLEEIRQRKYQYTSPGPFGRAVGEARELARWGDTDRAWRVLAAAVPQWEPYGEDHVAPFGLLGDPLLGPLVTPERGRQLLMTPRAGQEGVMPAPAAVEGEAARDGLAWLTHHQPRVELRRDAYRFVLVEGIRPEELAKRFGTGPLEPMESEWDSWDLPFSRQHERRGPVARLGAVDGWSFAFESARWPGFDRTRLTHPGTELSRGTRALTVWWEPGLFHLGFAEDGQQRYAFTVQEAERHQTGDIPAELYPDHLFPDPAGPATDLSDESRALEAIATRFGVSLPEFALNHGRLPTLPTRPWLRPPEPREVQARLTFTRHR